MTKRNRVLLLAVDNDNGPKIKRGRFITAHHQLRKQASEFHTQTFDQCDDVVIGEEQSVVHFDSIDRSRYFVAAEQYILVPVGA